MKALSLFSGIGGIDLACEWAGIETVAFCEREPFPQKVLRKHWPNIPIYDDVCTLTKERLDADGIGTIDIIHGGYPCQPFSTAGDRQGANDDRHLWPEVRRLIEAIRPRWFVGENVAGHVSLGLDDVLTDLGDIGYTAQSFVIPANSVGASHRRDRVFIVANSDRIGRMEYARFAEAVQSNWHDSLQREESKQPNLSESVHRVIPHDTYADSEHVQGSIKQEVQGEQALQGIIYPGSIAEWAERSAVYQPKLLRSYHGVSDGMDRLKALGNAVVPQQIYPILAAIKQIDDMMREEKR